MPDCVRCAVIVLSADRQPPGAGSAMRHWAGAAWHWPGREWHWPSKAWHWRRVCHAALGRRSMDRQAMLSRPRARAGAPPWAPAARPCRADEQSWTAVLCGSPSNTLQHAAAQCNMLRHSATCCAAQCNSQCNSRWRYRQSGCSAAWATGPWGACSTTSSAGPGVRTRTVRCNGHYCQHAWWARHHSVPFSGITRYPSRHYRYP